MKSTSFWALQSFEIYKCFITLDSSANMNSLNTKDLILLKYNQNCLVQYLSCIYYYDRLMNYDRKEETNNCQKCKVLYMNGAKANWTHEYEWKIMN